MLRRPDFFASFPLTRLLCFLCFAAVVFFCARNANADENKGSTSTTTTSDAEKATAEHLFQEGRVLFERRQLEEACAKFSASARIEPAPGTLLNLAECYEAVGRNASAWARYRELQVVAARRGQQRRADHAAERIRTLEPTLSHLVVEFAERSPPETMTVRQDDVVDLDRAAWGSRLPIDPGSHSITASAPGFQTYQTKIVVEARRDVHVRIPKLLPASQSPIVDDTSSPSSGSKSGLRTAGIVALVVGGVAALGSVGFGLGAKLENDKAREDECGPTTCTSAGDDRIERAIGFGHISTGLAIGAGAAIAFGVVTLIVVGKTTTTTTKGASSSPASFGNPLVRF